MLLNGVRITHNHVEKNKHLRDSVQVMGAKMYASDMHPNIQLLEASTLVDAVQVSADISGTMCLHHTRTWHTNFPAPLPDLGCLSGDVLSTPTVPVRPRSP